MSATRPLLSQTTNRWMRRFLVIMVALGGASCSWFSSNRPRPPVEIKGPLVTMLIASSVDGKGKPVNPRFAFPPTEPQIRAIVQVGNTAPSALTVTWYQKSDDAPDKKLFEHQIQVKDHDLAFSTGKNPGPLLLVGSYKVVAAIGGETKELEFDIAPPRTASNKTSGRLDDGRFADQVQFEGSVMRQVAWNESPQGASSSPSDSTATPGQPPVAGSSGITPQTNPSDDFDFVSLQGSDGDNDLNSDGVEVLSSALPKGQSDHGAVSIYETIRNTRLGVYTYDASGFSRAAFNVDPCWLNGSDLPGNKIPVKAIMRKDATLTGPDSGVEVNYVSIDITLGDDTSKPRVHIVSTPARGSKVKEGDKINLKVDATELKTGGSWQTGVKMIQVIALPGGQVGEPWINSASPLSQKCTQKTWEQKYEATYIVPKNPPPIIKICALAEDYVGNEASNCGDFPSGKWYGSLDWSAHQTMPSGPQDWTGHADLALDEDGKGGLTGTLAGSETQTLGISECHGVTTWTVNARLAGTLSAQQMILNAIDRQSTRPEEASCGRARTGGDIFMWPRFDELLRGLTAAGDGGYRSERDFGITSGSAKFTLTVRPSR